MNAILDFDLPDDEAELMTALRAKDYLASLHAFREKLRTLHKYGHSFVSADEAVQVLYQEFCQLVQGFLD